MQAVSLEDVQPCGRPKDAGDLYCSLVIQRRATAEDNVRGIVAAKEVLCFWRHVATLGQFWIGRVVLGDGLSQRLWRVLKFEGMHDAPNPSMYYEPLRGVGLQPGR
jgi:hypothetical protein